MRACRDLLPGPYWHLMDLAPPSPHAGWLHQVIPRLSQWWLVKMLGLTLGMSAFFIAYFWVLNHPLFPVTVMPLTPLDHLLHFQPAALPLYLSLWFYVSLAPALIIERRELFSYGVAAIALSLFGLGCFLAWPTAVPPSAIDWSHYPAFVFLKAADAAGNACPSLHVAFAVFTAAWLDRTLRQMRAGRVVRTLNWLWCAGIAYSTIATRQHVVLDILAGAALGGLTGWIALRLLRRRETTFPQGPSCSAVGTTQR